MKAHARSTECAAEDCARPTKNAGYCWTHYYRMRRYGSTEPGPRGRAPLAERFLRYVIPGELDACWLWTGSRDGHNYGTILSEGGRQSARHLMAHRVAYEMWVGPIPVGLDIDHLCRTPLCVNPAHMEPVTRGENTRRGTAHQRIAEIRAAARESRTECAHGHPWILDDLYERPNGTLCCRECARISCIASRARKKAVSQ